MGEYSHNVMKILVFSNVTRDILSFSKLHGMKSFGVRIPTIFKFVRFMSLENIRYAESSAKASFM